MSLNHHISGSSPCSLQSQYTLFSQPQCCLGLQASPGGQEGPQGPRWAAQPRADPLCMAFRRRDGEGRR